MATPGREKHGLWPMTHGRTKRGECKMGHNDQGIKIGILVAAGVSEPDLVGPRETIERAGLTSFIIAPESGRVITWNRAASGWGRDFEVDVLPVADPVSG